MILKLSLESAVCLGKTLVIYPAVHKICTGMFVIGVATILSLESAVCPGMTLAVHKVCTGMFVIGVAFSDRARTQTTPIVGLFPHSTCIMPKLFSLYTFASPLCCRHNRRRPNCVHNSSTEWSLSNLDSLWTEESVFISEVS